MWQRFSERARRVVFYAQEEAQRWSGSNVATEHLLLGLIREPDSIGCQTLGKLNIDLNGLRLAVESKMVRGEARASQDMTLTPLVKRVIDFAYEESRSLGNNYIGSEHLLLGLIRVEEGLAGKVFESAGVTLEAARREVTALQSTEKVAATPMLFPKPTLEKWAEYSESGKATIFRALAERAKYEHPSASAEHFLLAIAGDPRSQAAQILSELGATPEKIRAAVEKSFENQAKEK